MISELKRLLPVWTILLMLTGCQTPAGPVAPCLPDPVMVDFIKAARTR